MPGARVGAGAVIEPGTCVAGRHPGAGGLGRFACAVRGHRGRFVARRRSVGARSWWTLVYTASLFGCRLDPAARRAARAGHARLGGPPRHDPGGRGPARAGRRSCGHARVGLVYAALLALRRPRALPGLQAGLPQGRQPRGLGRLAGREHGRRRPCDALPALRRPDHAVLAAAARRDDREAASRPPR